MDEYYLLGDFRVFGAPIYIHWSVIAAIVLILFVYRQDPIIVTIALLSFFSIIFVHEVGHAALANSMGYQVFALRICLIHGVCEYQAPSYEWDEVKVAWGGVLAQIWIAAIVFTAASLGARHFAYFGPILVFLGYYSLLVVPYNLLPIQGLDGYTAWRIIPLSYRYLKTHPATRKFFNRNRR
jgi:Zn-dependent protease